MRRERSKSPADSATIIVRQGDTRVSVTRTFSPVLQGVRAARNVTVLTAIRKKLHRRFYYLQLVQPASSSWQHNL